MKFWAKRGRAIVGPFESRESALAAFIAANPWRGPAYAATAAKNQIMTGYGEFGPYSDMHWHSAAETTAGRASVSTAG